MHAPMRPAIPTGRLPSGGDGEPPGRRATLANVVVGLLKYCSHCVRAPRDPLERDHLARGLRDVVCVLAFVGVQEQRCSSPFEEMRDSADLTGWKPR